MNGSTCSFLSGTALCIYAIASYLYRSDFPLVAVIVLAVVGVGVIVAGLFQLMIERWGVPLDPEERPRR
ncbi:hypothetical protein [Enterococcus faecium]|uniref:hypothetical protein n=1 Tax=Enterococcus faecium TaxID=1352 RepID=UPI0012B65A96|nr:hypothetical protein [Enterococcus faecium]